MSPRKASILTCAAIAITLGGAPAYGQKLKDKTKPANHPVNCPYTGGDPELLARAGILSLGGFEFGATESTEKMDAYLGVCDVKWVETEHFKIGMALGPYKIPLKQKKKIQGELKRLAVHWPEFSPGKVRSLDPWLRAYVYALRAEDVWREMLELLDVQDSDFPDGSKPWDTTSEYMGIGPYLGEKGKPEVLFLPSEALSRDYLRHFFGLITRQSQRWNIADKDVLHLVIHTDQGGLKNDAALHGHFAFNMTQQLMNAYKHYSYEIPVWLKEGVAHWIERRINPDFNSFNSSEGAVADMTSKSDWKPPTRALVHKQEAPSMASLMRINSFGELKLEHHFTTWSMIDYLMSEHPKFVGQLMDRIKGMVNDQFIDDATGLADRHREAFKEILGFSYGQFDRAWAAWVLGSY